MGSPLGLMLAGIFLVELERKMLPTLTQHMGPWKSYVDGSISYMKEESMFYLNLMVTMIT